jgi:C4-dicarboxylate-binding protein DctP
MQVAILSKENVMKRRMLLGALVITLSLLWAFPVPGVLAADPKYTVKLGCVEIPTSALCRGMDVFKSYTEGAAGGDIKVDLYTGGQLGDLAELYEGVKSGLYQITQGDETITGFYEPMVILSIPYLFSNELVVQKFFESDYFRKLNDDFAKKTGVRIIGAGVSGFRSFTNSKRPIKSMEDMKGLKIRVQPVPVMMELVKALGASPTPIAWSELYSALQQGVVDGQENPPATILDAKFYEVQKHFTSDEHGLAWNLYYANEKWWKSLPANVRQIFWVGARLGATVETGVRLHENRVGAVKELEKKGVQVYAAPMSLKEKFRAAAQPPVVDFLKKKVGAEVVDGALKTVKEIEAQIARQAN